MLKKLPNARVWIESDRERQQRFDRRRKQFIDEDPEHSVFWNEIYPPLRRKASKRALLMVQEAVYQAVKVTVGDEGVLMLDKHAKECTKTARQEARRARGDYHKLWSAWLDAVETQVWGIPGGFYHIESIAEAPANSLIRLAFPGLERDCAKYRRIEKRDGGGAARAALERIFGAYDFKTFVSAHSELVKDHQHRSRRPGKLGLCRLGSSEDMVKTRELDEAVGKIWDKTNKISFDDFPPLEPKLFVGKGKQSKEFELYIFPKSLDPEGQPRILRQLFADHCIIDTFDGHTYWWWKGTVYETDEQDLKPEEVAALLGEREHKKRARIAKAKDLEVMREGSTSRSQLVRKPIPEEVRHAIWRRDEGRCAECDSQENLEFDHIIPLAMGGSNSERNLQLLCEDCNRRKGATLG